MEINIRCFKKYLPAAFLSRSTNDAVGLNQGAAEPLLLLVADEPLHVRHHLLVLLRPLGQLLQPGDVLLEVGTQLLGNTFFASAAYIVSHIEQRGKTLVNISKIILKSENIRRKSEKKADGVHDEKLWGQLRVTRGMRASQTFSLSRNTHHSGKHRSRLFIIEAMHSGICTSFSPSMQQMTSNWTRFCKMTHMCKHSWKKKDFLIDVTSPQRCCMMKSS